jgi:chromosome segregation ATPase
MAASGITATDVTAYVGIVIAVVSSIGIPIWLARRKNQADDELGSAVSWKGLTTAIQKERDDLREQLDAIEARHRDQMKNIESDWEQRMSLARSRITQLEEEVATLKRLLSGGSMR